MSSWIIYSIGFLAQIFFSIRLLVQWLVSEKAKRVLTPSIFWKFSLLGSVLLFIYGYFRDDFAIMTGQVLTYYIYIRNLQLQGVWKKTPAGFRIFLILFPALTILYGIIQNKYNPEILFFNEAIPPALLILGVIAQILFTFRFIYQWIYSERSNESILPIGFWRISAMGAALILVYAVFRKDPVLFAGHIAGMLVYMRNIYLWKKQHTSENK